MSERRARRALAVAFALAALTVIGGCTSSDDNGAIDLPIGAARVARELLFLTIPPVSRLSPEEYATQSEQSANETTDESLKPFRDAYGRLGFFARNFDPRTTARSNAAFYAAFYSHETKAITVIGDATIPLLVHELTHALQDQHFDLTRFFATATSSDEALAQRALVEGDAVIAAYRYEAQAKGYDPTASAAENVTAEVARQASERLLDDADVPHYFVALPSFAYTFGVSYVATQLRVRSGVWEYPEIDRQLAERGPASTQAVLRGGIDVDPIEPTGFSALPADIAADHKVTAVDRLGEYYTYLLLRPVRTLAAPFDLRELTSAWDGDQLVSLERTDGATAIVWTSVWETEEAAARIEDTLVRLHTGSAAATPPAHAYSAADGEPLWIEHRGTHVCLVRNVDAARMEHLAHVALSTTDEKRMAVVNLAARLPPVVH